MISFTPGQLLALICLLLVTGGLFAIGLQLFLNPKARKRAQDWADPAPRAWPADERGFPQRRAEDLLRQTHADVRRDRLGGAN